MHRLYSREVRAGTARVYRGAMSVVGTKRTWQSRSSMSAFGGIADIVCVANHGIGRSCRDCPCLARPWTMVLGAAFARRIFDLTQKLLFAAAFYPSPVARVAMSDGWIIYAVKHPLLSPSNGRLYFQ
jgi:hypothetical protein